MSGGVGNDEAAARGGKIQMRYVDSDALFALRLQAVGKQRQVQVRAPTPLGGLLEVVELVGEQRLAVVEQATNECAFAVIDAAGGGEAK